MIVEILMHGNAGFFGTMSSKKIGTPAGREENVPCPLDFRQEFKCRDNVLYGISRAQRMIEIIKDGLGPRLNSPSFHVSK